MFYQIPVTSICLWFRPGKNYKLYSFPLKLNFKVNFIASYNISFLFSNNLCCSTPQRQLRLFDMRQKGTQIHEFGWNQESSTLQSALINQSWSPDGLYLTSGSADPMIHIFDIRFNATQPSQSNKAHQKRVFKAAWHKSYPLLISKSSDLNIGLHNINM